MMEKYFDGIIRKSLTRFQERLKENKWIGRENEALSQQKELWRTTQKT